MLALNSPKWRELRHAYGPADDIPDLLRQLRPKRNDPDAEPWFSLWSSLAHQGDVYTASFAAVPWVVAVAAAHPVEADATYLQFPAWVEICRQRAGTSVQADLSEAYFAALQQLPGIIAAASTRAWDETFVQCALAALAAAKGSGEVAEAALELSPEVAREFKDWFFSR